MTLLVGRHALVTGANRGIGAAVARALSAAGADVTLLVRDAAKAADVRAAMTGRVHVVTADVTDGTAVRAACESAVAALGPLQILVNNAGSATSSPFLRTPIATFEQMMAVHLYGAIHATQAVLPGMLSGGFGRIVNVASVAGLRGHAYVSAYVAAKHALVGLTRSLAHEVASKGVTVNAVCPGYTDTDMSTQTIETIMKATGRSADEARQAIVGHTPLGRLVRPEEVASLVAWLCGSEAAAITGQALMVDGGDSV